MESDSVIGVVGLGTMGLGIVQVYAQAGMTVRATDRDDGMRGTAVERLHKGLERRVASGKMTEAARAEMLARVEVVPSPADMGGCDMVIEAIVERIDAKADLFATLERVMARDAILATNTSSLSVSQISSGLNRPERLIGLHFFNPAPVMKLVELVTHPGAAEAALDRAEALTRAAGKTVIRCGDRPGFIVNRCARPFSGEALILVEEGVADPAQIDAAMRGAGYRLGPFSLIDLIGADVSLAASESVAAQMDNHPRYRVSPLLRRQVESGDLGRKSGRGFVYPHDLPEPPANATEIVDRIEATLANEAASLLAEGATSESDIDTAMKLGLNYPRGPFESARGHGVGRVVALLESLESAAPAELAPRYRPLDALREMAD